MSRPPAPGATAVGGADPDRRRRFTRNLLWNYAAGLTSIFGLVLLYPLAIRLAGAERYGLWVLAFGATQLLVLTDFGIGDGVVRQMGAMVRAGASHRDQTRFVSVSVSLFTALSVALSLLFLVALPLYLSTVSLTGISQHEYHVVLGAGAVAVFLAVTARGMNAVLWAQDRQDIERKSAVVGLLVRIAGYGVAAVSGTGLIGVIAAEVVGAAVTPIVCSIAVWRRFRGPLPSVATLRTYAPPLLRLGSVLFVGSLAGLAALQLPLFIVGSTLGLLATTAFGAIMRVFASARLVNSWMANPFINGIASATRTEMSRRARLCFVMTGCVGVTLAVVVVGLAPDLIAAWLGVSFVFAAPALAATAMGMLADALNKPSALVINLRGKPWIISVLNVSSLVGTVVAVVIATRTSDLGWVAAAATAIPLLLSPIYVLGAARVLGEFPLPRRPLAYLALAGVSAAALLAISAISRALQPWPAVLTVAGIGVLALAAGFRLWKRRTRRAVSA